jgi:curved DNA-binding protein
MPVEFKDYYAILGVPRDASDADIKQAFRKLARKYHPDVANDKVTAEEKFKQINEANEVLRDPEKRRKYDELGAGWDRQPPPQRRRKPGSATTGEQEFHFGGTGFSDFFERFFGGGEVRSGETEGFGPSGRARRGHDIKGDILITLDEVMHGSIREISLQKLNPATRERETHAFKVRIPPGAPEGQPIRVPGKGGAGRNGGVPGDLYLHARYATHPDFRVRGADLYRDLPIAPWEAVLGSEANVKTLDGTVKLRIPSGQTSGGQLRLRGRGLPKGRSEERGDLFVTLSVQVPRTVTAEERALWEKLRAASSFDPRSHD